VDQGAGLISSHIEQLCSLSIWAWVTWLAVGATNCSRSPWEVYFGQAGASATVGLPVRAKAPQR
jgi:hypothetical protein